MPAGSAADTFDKFDHVKFESDENAPSPVTDLPLTRHYGLRPLIAGRSHQGAPPPIWRGTVTAEFRQAASDVPPPPLAVIASQPLLCNRPSACEINDGHL